MFDERHAESEIDVKSTATMLFSACSFISKVR